MESGAFGAGFKRAADLSRGRRWGILGLLLYIPLGAFTSAIGAILPAVVYYLLRAEKEGVGIDEIAGVFD